MAELVCYRAAAYRTPIRSRPHGLESAGRFHDPGGPATQYFCLHPLGPWAEVIRHQGWADAEGAAEVRVAVWAVRVITDVEPLRIDFEAADRGGLPHPIAPEELVGDDLGPCRELARDHRLDPGKPKLLRVPSAALPGTDNLVLLGARRGIEYLREPRRRTQLPYASTAVDGRSPRALFEHVRRPGRPHAGLEAWRRGEPFALPELDLSRP